MPNETKMPWGKFRGEFIEDLPSGYLRWLSENCDDDFIATKADEEFQWREDNGGHKWDD